MDKNLPNQFGMAKTSQIMGYSPRQLAGQILLWQEGYPNEPKIGKIQDHVGRYVTGMWRI